MKIRRPYRFVLFLIMILLVGCESMTKEEIQAQPTREEVKQEILDHLEEKYGEEFECQSIEYKSWAQGGHENMIAYPKSGDENHAFIVNRYTEKDGSIRYEDGYVGLVMDAKYQAIVNEIVGKYAPNCIVTSGLDVAIYPDSFTPEMPYNEFKSYTDRKVTVYVTIFIDIPEDESRGLMSAISEELKEQFTIGYLTIQGYSPENFQTDIVEDSHGTQDRGAAYPTVNLAYELDDSWGEINFDYQYEEEAR